MAEDALSGKTHPRRARLVVLGTPEHPSLAMTEPRPLPLEYWSAIETPTNVRSAAVRIPDDPTRVAAALRYLAGRFGPPWHRLVLDVEGDGLYAIGALSIHAGEVKPGGAAPLLSRLLEGADLRSRGWHVTRELRALCRAHPGSEAEATRCAWETLTCANLLLSAVYGDLKATGWTDLGLAVGKALLRPRNLLATDDDWATREREERRRLVAEQAERDGKPFLETLVGVAAGGAMAAAAGLRAGGPFRLGNRTKEVEVMVLPELARAFQSRAINATLSVLGYNRRAPVEEPPSEGISEPPHALAAVEAVAPGYLRAGATAAECGVLDALEAAAAVAFDGQDVREVAAQELGIKPETLRTHIRNILKKAAAGGA